MAKKNDTAKKNNAADTKRSSIRYDDFIANVHSDPAKPEATIMLAGFIGHGASGEVRIYPDASLGQWYEVAEDDVVHAMPVPDAKLGGSYVWVRASAPIKPGAAAAGTGAVAAAQPAMPFTLTCTLNAAAPVGGWPPSLGCQPSVMACPHAALHVQTNPPTLGCTGGCNALGAALVGGWPPSLGCQPSFMACPPAALHVQTNPPTLGCTGGCNVLGAAQTFTMGLPCQHLRGGVFTPYGG